MKRIFKLPLVAGALLACSAWAQQAQAQTQTTINFAITQPAALQANAGISRNFCPGQNVTLQGTATGGTGPYTYAWTPAVTNPTSAQPTVTPTATTTYSVAITDAVGCTATASVTLTQIICTGISEDLTAQLQLYPNPAKGNVLLKLETTEISAYRLQLTNLVGQQVISRQVAPTRSLKEELNLEGLANGIYLLQVSSQNGTATRKLIVE